jgi:hypothetical protein
MTRLGIVLSLATKNLRRWSPMSRNYDKKRLLHPGNFDDLVVADE